MRESDLGIRRTSGFSMNSESDEEREHIYRQLWHVQYTSVKGRNALLGCRDLCLVAHDDDSVAFGGCDPSVVWWQRSYPLDDSSTDTTRGVIPWFVAYLKRQKTRVAKNEISRRTRSFNYSRYKQWGEHDHAFFLTNLRIIKWYIFK